MQKILIVEDDISQLTILEQTIKENKSDWIVKTASSREEALKLIATSLEKCQPFTLFLLDVQLTSSQNDRGGFHIAETLRTHKIYQQTPLLFLTSVPDPAYYALSNYHCYNYLPKPYSPEDILNQLEQLQITGYLRNNTLNIRDTERFMRHIKLSDIHYISAKSHTITLHTTKSIITSREYSLDAILEKLGNDFIRCHKGYIVNINYVEKLDKSHRCLNVYNQTIPIGKKLMTEVELAFAHNNI